jgi:hypothetical protein
MIHVPCWPAMAGSAGVIAALPSQAEGVGSLTRFSFLPFDLNSIRKKLG